MNVNITNPIFHNEDKARDHISESRWPDGLASAANAGLVADLG